MKTLAILFTLLLTVTLIHMSEANQRRRRTSNVAREQFLKGLLTDRRDALLFVRTLLNGEQINRRNGKVQSNDDDDDDDALTRSRRKHVGYLSPEEPFD